VVDQQHILVVVEDDGRSGEVPDAGHGVGPSHAMVAMRATIHSTAATGRDRVKLSGTEHVQ
jgi:hypothetical protein